MIKINFTSYKNFDERTVKDEDGREIMSFEEAKALPTRSCYSINNSDHKKIGTIEKSRYNFGLFDLPRIVIHMNDDKIEVRKEIKQLEEIYQIIGNEFSVVGNWDGPHFNICKNEDVLASVDVQRKATGGTYLVNIIDKSNEEQLISLLFALSWIR